MDFELTEELGLIRDMARDFAEGELKPRAAQHDRDEALDPAVVAKIGELGLWGLTVPEELGGAGMGNLALSVALEEINRGCAATGVTVSVHNSLVCSPIQKWGTDEQKRAWLPRLATGEGARRVRADRAGLPVRTPRRSRRAPRRTGTTTCSPARRSGSRPARWRGW